MTRATRETGSHDDAAGFMRQPSGRTDALVLLLGTAIGSALLLARRPSRVIDIAWAEDGARFLHDAAARGFSSAFETYAGYYHLVPRTIALVITAVVPVEWWAVATSVAAAIVAAACIAGIITVAMRVVRSRLIIVCLWWALIALPVAGGEVVLSIANLHWYLMFAAFWCAAVPVRQRRINVLASLLVFVAILSDPLTALLVCPALVARVITRPWRESRLMLIAATVATVIQGAASIASLSQRTMATAHPGLSAHVHEFGLRVVLAELVGVTAATWLAANLAHILVLAAFGAVAGVALSAYFAPAQRWRTLAFLGAAVGINAVTYTLQGQLIGSNAWTDFVGGDRYTVTAAALFISALAFAADGIARGGRRRGAVALVAFSVIAVAPGIRDFNWGDERAETPRWSDSIREARLECADGGDRVLIPIAPAPWSDDLSCAIIGDSAP